MVRKSFPSIHAGSTADISFLLLIFFLVTTTIQSEKGINRSIPDKSEVPIILDSKKRNVLEIHVNAENQFLINENVVHFHQLFDEIKNFIDNGAGSSDEPCLYCKGPKDINSSESPQKAIIDVHLDPQSNYSTYISLQNELNRAYFSLRNRLALEIFSKSYQEMEYLYRNANGNEKIHLKNKLEEIKIAYPIRIADRTK